jgi:L-threonylcarbamoyladenylate synthase
MRVDADEAARILRAGGIVAVPTETVYGLAAVASDPVAVRRVFAAKGRPVDHPLIVHLASAADLGDWAATVPPAAAALAAAFWPGPLTLVLPRRAGVPDEVTGGLDTVGLRVPAHPLTRALIAATGGLAAPSANRFGRVSPTEAAHVSAELGPALPVLDGGPCAVGVESTIVDLAGPAPALLRPGGVPVEAIEAVLGAPLGVGVRRAPGVLPSHYAPRTALLLSSDVEADAAAARARGLRVAVLPAPSDPAQHARGLYAALRALDAEGVDLLVAGVAAEAGLGRAVNDRLRRAAHGSGRP